MTEEAIVELTKLMIKEHIDQSTKKYVFTKEELLKFCIKMLKKIKQFEEVKDEQKL